jgi:tetratricopeptide (TPR) repeat protein
MRARSLAVVVVAALCAQAQAQPAQRRQEAAEHFNRATTAEKEGRHEDAIREYELAYSLVPHADVLYNIGFNYEKLDNWAKAADYYQRYLDERAEPPADADAVRAKIQTLRARVATANAGPPVPPPSSSNDATGVQLAPQPGNVDSATPPLPPAAEPKRTALHGGASYGLGMGDALMQRFLAHGGVRIAQRIDADAIIGSCGKNDRALGVMSRLLIARSSIVASFARAAVTIGYAKQDASSSAETKFPLGFEAGAGVQIGAKGKIEIDAVVRFVRGGWDAESTTADGFVNDSVAFAVDVGFVFDVPVISGGRRD